MIPIPYMVDNPRRSFPIVTLCLIALNAAIYFGSAAGGDVIYIWEQYGLDTTHISVLTLITHQFLHGGIMHLAGNMLYLWLFGANLEDLMGKIGFIVYYLLSGIVAALLFIVVTGTGGVGVHNLIGASGAISGVMGGYFVMFPKSRVRCVLWIIVLIIPFTLPAVVFLGFYLVMQFMMIRMMDYSNVAYAAHIGGFLFGAGVLYLLIATRAVIVPNIEWVKRGEYALLGPADEFLGRLSAAYQKDQFGAVPKLYRELLQAEPQIVFDPDQQMRVARAVQKGSDPALAVEAYRRIMVQYSAHPLAQRAGLEIAKILAYSYKDARAAWPYLQWVIQSAGGVGPVAAEAHGIARRLYPGGGV